MAKMKAIGICLAVGLLRWLPAAEAHGTIGTRVFIEPLFTEDANVKNELVLPMMKFLVQPDGTWRTVEFSFEKVRIRTVCLWNCMMAPSINTAAVVASPDGTISN